MLKYKNIINKFSGKKILVIGDLILDHYIKGNVSRISPEAPVPVVLQDQSFYTPGGSANVANNLSSLGAKVTVVGKIGHDLEGALLKRELKRRKISVDGVFTEVGAHTILKTRIIAQNQQVVRVDRESVLEEGIDAFKDKKIWPFVQKFISTCDAVIISDYGKGMIDPAFVEKVSSAANKKGIPITVDPKLDKFKLYGKVTSITPNKKEAETALLRVPEELRETLGTQSLKLNKTEDIVRAGKTFLEYLDIESILITLGEQGMYLFERGKTPFPIATQAREVFDVSGAGDTVISVFTLALAAGATKRQAADIANYAAGVVVGKMGAVAITKEELLEAIKDRS
jgi:D-glycero-beta-D-manno-heptose-7-phosphate kinase